MSFYEDKISERLGGKMFGKNTEMYKFAKIKKAKEDAIKVHPNLSLIDLGIGEPDKPAHIEVVKTLAVEAGKIENRLYADNGIPEFQEAAALYLEKVYHLKGINPYTDIIHGIGSKPILSMLPMCFINPGDITLTTTPGYPLIATYTRYLGGDVYTLPLYKENNFYPNLSTIPKDVLKKAKLLYINYPNNPTGQVATIEFYKKVVEFAYKNNIIIVSDAAYAPITFDGYQPLSFLSIDGAKEVGVELHSLSKAYNMTGWRLAFIVGDPLAIKAYGTIKDNTDSGQFRAIQKAAIYALNHTEISEENCQRYSRRLNLLISALKEVGFDAKKPKGTFYCYVPIPKGTKSGVMFKSAEEVSDYLIRNSLISTVPWDDAGSYLRLSVTFSANTYNEEIIIIEELKRRLLELELIF
jgi:LL-diaminopimelate aminotransferase